MDHNEFLQNLSMKYECDLCYFISCNKTNFRNHLETKKHKNRKIISNNNDFLQKNATFDCDCGKSYKHKPNLYAHKKKCKQTILTNKEDEVNYKEIIKTLLEQNNSLQNTIKDLIPKIGGSMNNSNINSNNKNFNICLFLNENCKDALSMDEFVKKIEVSIKDLLFTNEKGLVNGISNLLIKNLNDLPEKKRPLWCSDKKRKKIFVKEEEWGEDVDNVKTKQVIKDVRTVQIKNIHKYTEKNPDWKDKDDKKEEYMGIVKNITSDIDSKDDEVINHLVGAIYLDNDAKEMIT